MKTRIVFDEEPQSIIPKVGEFWTHGACGVVSAVYMRIDDGQGARALKRVESSVPIYFFSVDVKYGRIVQTERDRNINGKIIVLSPIGEGTLVFRPKKIF